MNPSTTNSFDLDIRQECGLELAKTDKELCELNSASTEEAIKKRLAYKEAHLALVGQKEETERATSRAEQDCAAGMAMAKGIFDQDVASCDAVITSLRQSSATDAVTLRTRREGLAHQAQETGTQMLVLQGKISRLAEWGKDSVGKELGSAFTLVQQEFCSSLASMKRAQEGIQTAEASIQRAEEALAANEASIGVYENRKRIAQENLFSQRNRQLAQFAEARAALQAKVDTANRVALEHQQAYMTLAGGHEFRLRAIVAASNNRLAQILDSRLRSERLAQESVPTVRQNPAADPGLVVSGAMKDYAIATADLLARKILEFNALLSA